MRTLLIGFSTALLLATPALADESCSQALKDDTAQAAGATISPKATATVSDLIKQAADLCKGDAASQAQGIDKLRTARVMMGE